MTASRATFEQCYDELRTVEMNKLYYGHRASRMRKTLKYVDVFLAFFGAGSAVLSLSLWNVQINNVQVGAVVLGVFTSIAVCVVAARPFLKMEDTLERCSASFGIYSSLSFMHAGLVERIKREEDVSAEVLTAYENLRSMRGANSGREDEVVNKRLRKSATEEVYKRFPTKDFYYPER